MNEENNVNVPEVITTNQPVYKRVLKIVLVILCLTILVFGLIFLFSKNKFAPDTKNQNDKQLKNTSAAAAGGGSATVSARTNENAEVPSALEGKIVNISIDTVSFETINHELITLPKGKLTSQSYMILNTPVKLILTKSAKDGNIIKAEVTKLNPK